MIVNIIRHLIELVGVVFFVFGAWYIGYLIFLGVNWIKERIADENADENRSSR